MIDEWTAGVHEGDCRDVLADLPAESVHACVTDPPYGLAFMGRDWDDFEPREYQQWCEEWARDVKRVLKPGAHLLAFSGNRTHHRAFSGVEDAGFEIRDTLTWHYGSGFPKASDVSKTIDKRADAEREVVGMSRGYSPNRDETNQHDGYTRPWMEADDHQERKYAIEEPATDAAKKWDGWKTGLKPATEFVVMARKPFDGATVDCVQEHGTGALNIDGTRIAHGGDDLDGGATSGAVEFTNEGWNRDWMDDKEAVAEYVERKKKAVQKGEELGRYPSNVVFDETEAERLDRAVGDTGEGTYTAETGSSNVYGDKVVDSDPGVNIGTGDSGGPSRYFYTSKASKAERTLDGAIDNAHPTVKPADLMEWLVRLVTAEGQTVLDPFAGSGTTCKAAKDLGREFIGIEKQAKWADVARVRVGLTPEDPARVRGDDGQQGLEAFADGGGER